MTTSFHLNLLRNHIDSEPPHDCFRPATTSGGWFALSCLVPVLGGERAERQGFFLEDKGWSLALHARFAADGEAEDVLSDARRIAVERVFSGPFGVLGGHRFLEIASLLAHKGRTVDYLLSRYAWPGARLLYLGDDDKDEEAFGVIKARGGVAVVVASEPRETKADCRLESPGAARRWLRTLLALLKEQTVQDDTLRR